MVGSAAPAVSGACSMAVTASARNVRIIERTTGAKELRIVRDTTSGSGVVEQDVPANEREHDTLTDAEATRLFDNNCANRVASGFLLYALYVRAAGFRVAPGTGI